MRVLVTCATGNLGKTMLATKSSTVNWVAASRSGQDHIKLDFTQTNTFDQVAEQSGALDGLVLIPPRVSQPTTLFPEPDEWNDYFNRYFINPLQFLKAVLESQKFPKPFKIVVIGGLSSICALPHYGSANAMRLAWLGQVKSLALQLGSDGVRINTLSLGAVMTENYANKLKRKASDNGRSYQDQMVLETENIPSGRYSTPEDVAQTVLAMLGPMSDQMSGQNLLVDGGFFRGY